MAAPERVLGRRARLYRATRNRPGANYLEPCGGRLNRSLRGALSTQRGWDRTGRTPDPTSALIGDAQVGVGWRKGAVQTSFGLIHREVKGQHMVFGQQAKDDSLVAFSLSIKPRK